MLAAYDEQLRGHVPDEWPIGVAYVVDGEVVRAHYGTHGVVENRALTSLDGVVGRQQEAFAERGEPVEWKVYSHDSPGLPAELLAAGFAPGWQRSLLIAPIEGLRGEISPSVHPPLYDGADPIHDFASRATDGGPHRAELAKLETDGMGIDELSTLVLQTGDQLDAVGWAHHLDGTEFIELGGMTQPVPEFLAYWAAWSRFGPQRRLGWPPPEARFLVAEAAGALREMLLAAGFTEVSSVQSYHWTPSKPPALTRPVTMVFFDPEYGEMWARIHSQLSFAPDPKQFPGIAEPAPSVTWPLGSAFDTVESFDSLEESLTDIFRRHLPAVVPAEDLYWLDWHHVGYRFDPQRVGGAGQPEWPGAAYPNGDYYLYVTADLRLGTFGHPSEHTLCVFGADLLAATEAELTDLLGPPLRKSSGEM